MLLKALLFPIVFATTMMLARDKKQGALRRRWSRAREVGDEDVDATGDNERGAANGDDDDNMYVFLFLCCETQSVVL